MAVFFLAGYSAFTGSASIERTIARSREIEAHLVETAKYLEAYSSKFGRLPSDQEAEVWKRQAPDSALRGATWWSGPPFESEAVERLGAPQPAHVNPYVISYWRGEWREYYASWNGKTSLTFESSSYYALGSRHKEVALDCALALLCVLASWRMWPNHSFKRTRLRRSA
jgi:hypothetical protein